MDELEHVEAYAWKAWRPALVVPVPQNLKTVTSQSGVWVLFQGTGNTRWLPFSSIHQPVVPSAPAAAVWQRTASRLGDITNFAEANTTKPLYPGVSGDWLSLDDDEEARQALAALPPHLRGVLEEEGRQVQLCRPDSLRGKLECWASPLNGLLQVLVVRAMDLLQGRNPFWTEACWLEVVEDLKLPGECLPSMNQGFPAGLAAALSTSSKRPSADFPNTSQQQQQQQEEDAAGHMQSAALPAASRVAVKKGALPAAKRRHLLPDTSQRAGPHQGQASSAAGPRSAGAAAAGQVPPGDPGNIERPGIGLQGAGQQQQQQSAHAGALSAAAAGAEGERRAAAVSNLHLGGCAASAAAAAAAGGGGRRGGGDGRRPPPAAPAALPNAPDQASAWVDGARLPPQPPAAAVAAGGGQAQQCSAAAPAAVKGPPITSASSLQPGHRVVLWEVYAGGLVVVRELLLIRQLGRGSFARVFEAVQLSFQKLQQDAAAADTAATTTPATPSSSNHQQTAPDGTGVYFYAEGPEKLWFYGRPVNLGNGQRLALKVSLGWDDLDAGKQQRVGGDAASFAAEQQQRMSRELAMCQLSATETPHVISAYGRGSMHLAPGMPVGAAAGPSGVAPAGAGAAPPASALATPSAAAAAAAGNSAPPVAHLLQGVSPGAGAALQHQPVQLAVCGMLMEIATCTLSQYITSRLSYPGADVQPRDGVLLGLRHSENLRREAKGLLCQVIHALLSLERLNLLHRDIKAENILLTALPTPAAPASGASAPPAAAAVLPAVYRPSSSSSAAASAAPDWPAVGQGCISWSAKLSDFGVAVQTSAEMPRVVDVAGTYTHMPSEMLLSTYHYPVHYGNAVNTWAVGLLYLEMLFGQPPLYYRTIVRQSERTIIQKDLNDESTPYGGNNLTDDDRKFLLPCTDAAPGRRPWLAQLLQDPWVQEYLGWPAGWKLSEMPHGSPY